MSTPTKALPLRSGFLADLIELGEEIGLSARQIVRLSEYFRRQETELIDLCAEIIAEAPFTRKDNDRD